MPARILLLTIVSSVLFSMCSGAVAVDLMPPKDGGFLDVPSSHWAYEYVTKASELGVIQGDGHYKFGAGRNVTRAEFAAMLTRLFKWDTANASDSSFSDVKPGEWYYQNVETCLQNGAVEKSGTFRPNEAISRAEMAEMLVRSLGYASLADQVVKYGTNFADVKTKTGFISVANGLGIVNGTSASRFEPDAPALREHAAAMMIRVHNGLSAKTEWLHGFYAIQSWGQRETLQAFDSVSFGWAVMALDDNKNPVCNMSSAGGNVLSLPNGYQDAARLAQKERNLSVFMDTSMKVNLSDGTESNICKAILLNPANRASAVDAIADAASRDYDSYGGRMFTGVTIDFEGLSGDELRGAFSEFMSSMSARLKALNLKLYVAVPPKMAGGGYYNGYDYRAIGKSVDKVILMAHDYHARSLNDEYMEAGYTDTPLTPFSEIFYALTRITDPDTGVEDRSKIALALSFDSNMWMLRDGKVVNQYATHPTMPELYNRLIQSGTKLEFSDKFKNPRIEYYDEKDQTDTVIWYEDERSVTEKLRLARFFGVCGVSLWRVGTIPAYEDPAGKEIYFNVWNMIANDR